MYIDKNELVNRFGAQEIDDLLFNLDPQIADLRIDAAISEAEAMVNSYLSKRYTIPVVASALVKGYAASLARYNLYDDIPTQTVETKYNNTVAALKDIATGKADLAGASTENEANAEGGKPEDTMSHVTKVNSAFDWSTY